MAISAIDQFNNVTFQQTNFWDFTIIEGEPNISVKGLATAALNAFEFMKFRVVSSNLPLPGLKTEASPVGKKHYSGRDYEGDFAITIKEDITWSAFAYFDNWMKSIYNFDTQTWIHPAPPPRTGLLTYGAGLQPDIPTATFLYQNLKIRGIGDVAQGRESPGALTLTVNLTFEKVVPVITGNFARTAVQSAINLIPF